MDQSATSAPATKRRRRWPVLLLVPVLLAVAVWWTWPRIDPRFVGTWSGYFPAIPPWIETIELRDDGTGASTPTYNDEHLGDGPSTGPTRPLCWWVRGNTLYLAVTTGRPGPIGRLWSALVVPAGGRAGFTVLQIDDRQLVMRNIRTAHPDPGSEIKLRRIKSP